MKHRLTYLAIALAALFWLGLGLLQPIAAEASRTTSGSQQPDTSSASAFCASWSGADKASCIKDFNAGKSGKSVVDTCPSSLAGFPSPGVNNTGPGTDFYKCEGPWAAGTVGAGGHLLGSGAATFCNKNFTGAYHSSCETGSNNSGEPENKACDKSDPAYDACVAGFANAGGNVNGNGGKGPSPGATSACNGKTGNLYFACTSGYDGQIAGQSKSDACQNFKGQALKVCQDAWGQSHTNNPSQPSPTTPCNLKAGCDLIATYVNPLINLLSVAFGLIAVISLILGGIQYSASQGDPQKASQAKDRISNTMIAIIAYLFLYALLQFLIPGGLFH